MTFDMAYQQAFEIKKRQLSKKQADRDLAIQDLYNNSPEYKKIILKLSKIGPELGIAAFSGDTDKFEELKKEAQKLNEAKNALMASANITDITFDCDICRDTGYFGREICDCVKRMAAEIILKDCKNSINPNLSFDDFVLDYYSDEPEGTTSPKKRMQGILKYVMNYTYSFSKETSENLLFIGNTGLGKTHLSLIIYNELIKRGFNVIYKPAFNLFSEIENEHFNKRSDTTYREVLNADLLIIDDLGSEFPSAFVKSVFYNIINSRLLASKPTIINTNVTLKEIENVYSPRVSSRILGNYTAKKFLGKDIRQIKKIQ